MSKSNSNCLSAMSFRVNASADCMQLLMHFRVGSHLLPAEQGPYLTLFVCPPSWIHALMQSLQCFESLRLAPVIIAGHQQCIM